MTVHVSILALSWKAEMKCVGEIFFLLLLLLTNAFNKCCFHTVAVDSRDLHFVFIRLKTKQTK